MDQEMYVRGTFPKVGDVFEIVYRVRLKEKNRLNEYPKKMVEMGYVIHFGARTQDPVIFLSNKEIFVPVLNPDEWQEVSVKLKITDRSKIIRILAATHFKVSKTGATINMPLYLVDPETGQYGTKEDYEGNLPVEYRYDPIGGSFTSSPSQDLGPVEENRRIIKMIKKLEPALSDSEALLLHSDRYRISLPKGIPRWDEKKQQWLEEEIFEYYLKDGWFKALREGKREEWIKREKKKVEDIWKEGCSNFFQNNNSFDSSYFSDRISFYEEKVAA